MNRNRNTRYAGALFAAMAFAGLAGCQPPEGAGEAGAMRGDVAYGAETFAQYCVACHGASAKGDGPLAARLPVPPADLTALALANEGRFPMDRVLAKIHGYPDSFHAEIMPQFGPLLEGPMRGYTDENGAAVQTPAALLQLGRYLQSLQAR